MKYSGCLFNTTTNKVEFEILGADRCELLSELSYYHTLYQGTQVFSRNSVFYGILKYTRTLTKYLSHIYKGVSVDIIPKTHQRFVKREKFQ